MTVHREVLEGFENVFRKFGKDNDITQLELSVVLYNSLLLYWTYQVVNDISPTQMIDDICELQGTDKAQMKYVFGSEMVIFFGLRDKLSELFEEKSVNN